MHRFDEPTKVQIMRLNLSDQYMKEYKDYK